MFSAFSLTHLFHLLSSQPLNLGTRSSEPRARHDSVSPHDDLALGGDSARDDSAPTDAKLLQCAFYVLFNGVLNRVSPSPGATCTAEVKVVLYNTDPGQAFIRLIQFTS